jgi:deoxyhypusine synthase
MKEPGGGVMQSEEYLSIPVEPFQVDEKASVREVLERMGNISFQGRNLSLAFSIWKSMLQDETTILLGLAGAMVPAGMRKIAAYLIEHRLVDCVVSTGANLFHDIHETLGRAHYKGHPSVNDRDLKDHGIDRIYDTFASEEEFYQTDRIIVDFAREIPALSPYTTREFLRMLGDHLAGLDRESGILTTAARKGVPVYCPAIGDSSIGIALSVLFHEEGKKILFDPVADVHETAAMVTAANNTGVVYIGGGTPKNFIQQTEVTASYMGGDVQGHKYAIQLTADAPHWGGLSGCTFEEAQSWGKIQKDARMVSVQGDATIALPVLVSGLAQSREVWDQRKPPDLSFLENKEKR